MDMDSTESPVHGQQEGSAYNGHFESVCYHPLLLFNRTAIVSCVPATWRRGLGLLLGDRANRPKASRSLCAPMKPEIYEALEERGADYAIRIPANKSLELEIEDILFRPPGRPSRKPLVRYKIFAIRRRVGPNWPWPRSSTIRASYSRASFVVTGACRAVRWCVSTTSTAEQWIKEGKLDAAVVPSLSGQRGTATTERAGLQPGEPMAEARAAATDQELVADELAAPVDEDRSALNTRGITGSCSRRDNRRLFGDMLRRIWALPVPGG